VSPTSKPLRVAIAGASGFIGRRAAAALTAAGHHVMPLRREDIATIHETTSYAGLAAIEAKNPDVLVWAAGKREPTLEANKKIHAHALVDVMDYFSLARIVYLSSGEVYGDAPLPYREDGPTLSASDYAQAKLLGENAAMSSCERNASPEDPAIATVLRLGLVYGPDQSPRMLIPRVVAALRANERFPLTHGEQTRDLVFVDDVAHAIVRAVESANAGTYNIASGSEARIRDVVEGIARAIATQQGTSASDLLGLLGFGEVALRPDEAHRYVMDVSRAREDLGWTATTSLAEGLARL
jgi:nucleoside-diphosphate-sugar epimerase